MSNVDRAKQFLPFNALKGYYELVKSEEKVVQDRIILSEDEIRRLDTIISYLDVGMMVKVTYYHIDSYISFEGMLAKIDPVYKTITVVNKKIRICDIIDITSKDLESLMIVL